MRRVSRNAVIHIRSLRYLGKKTVHGQVSPGYAIAGQLAEDGNCKRYGANNNGMPKIRDGKRG